MICGFRATGTGGQVLARKARVLKPGSRDCPIALGMNFVQNPANLSRTESTHKAMANLIAPQDFRTSALALPASSDRWQRQLEGVQDFDLVTEIVGRAFKPHSMELLDPLHTLNTRFYSTQVGRISLFFLEYGAEVKVAPDCFDGFVLVEIPLQGGGHYRCGRESLMGSTAHAAVMSPDKTIHLDLAPQLSQLIMRIDQSLIDQACAGHLGGQLRDPVSFGLHFDLGSQAGRAWTGMLNHVMEGVSSFPQLLDNAMYCRHIEQVFIDTLLYGHMHNYSHRFELTHTHPALAPGYVRRAVEYLEMHAAEPVTVDMLAAAVGVSSRALFVAFREAYDQTPMGYLREFRLQQVRRALLAGSVATESLTQLALQWGFFHYGRFAQYYRDRLGERPQETVRRRYH